MNAKILVVVLMAGALLVGCKTMEGSSVAASPAVKRTAQSGSKYLPRIEENAAYIAYVERVARRRGTAVHWVHKPVKRYVDRE
jgi:K+-transporting ATPase c subunit